jgi:hypothetical protein
VGRRAHGERHAAGSGDPEQRVDAGDLSPRLEARDGGLRAADPRGQLRLRETLQLAKREDEAAEPDRVTEVVLRVPGPGWSLGCMVGLGDGRDIPEMRWLGSERGLEVHRHPRSGMALGFGISVHRRPEDAGRSPSRTTQVHAKATVRGGTDRIRRDARCVRRSGRRPSAGLAGAPARPRCPAGRSTGPAAR